MVRSGRTKLLAWKDLEATVVRNHLLEVHTFVHTRLICDRLGARLRHTFFCLTEAIPLHLVESHTTD